MSSRRIVWHALAVVCAALLWSGALPVTAKPVYSKIRFPHADQTVANVINNLGAVAGQHDDTRGGTRGFLRTPDGNYTDFSVDGAVVTIPRGLSDDGAVGGRYDLPDDSIHGFFRDTAGNITAFDGPGLGAMEVAGMNASHDIVGTYAIDDQQNLGGFIRHEDGSFTLFAIDDAVPGGLSVIGIDAAGEVAGAYTDSNFARHAFVRTGKGKLLIIDAPGAGGGFQQGTDVTAINDRGWLAGSYTDGNDVSHAYLLRKPGGSFEPLSIPPSYRMAALNNLGGIAGCFTSNFRNHGFIRKVSGKIVTFDLPWGESEDMCPEDMNDAGQVTGHVRYSSFGDKEFGFLRTP